MSSSKSPQGKRFRVKIYNISAHGLASKDSNGFSDPFLKVSFDHVEKFQTDVIKKDLNPVWNIEKRFTYETNLPKQLDTKELEIICYDWDRFSSNDLIGKCSVDLYTLVCGPIEHNIGLRNKGEETGRICFSLEMEEETDVRMFLSDIQISNLTLTENPNPNSYLIYFLTLDVKNKETSSICKYCPSPSWKVTPYLSITTTLKELCKGTLVIELREDRKLGLKDPLIGSCTMEVKDMLDQFPESRHVLSFSENLKNNDMIVGNITASIRFEDLPTYAQSIGGVHSEKGVHGSTPYLNFCPRPKILTNEPAPEKLREFSSVKVNKNDVVDLSDLQQRKHSSSGDSSSPETLPGGWEKRIDSNGIPYYVDHNTKTSHWQLPSKNPRTSESSVKTTIPQDYRAPPVVQQASPMQQRTHPQQLPPQQYSQTGQQLYPTIPPQSPQNPYPHYQHPVPPIPQTQPRYTSPIPTHQPNTSPYPPTPTSNQNYTAPMYQQTPRPSYPSTYPLNSPHSYQTQPQQYPPNYPTQQFPPHQYPPQNYHPQNYPPQQYPPQNYPPQQPYPGYTPNYPPRYPPP